jgi:hypothetical protein
VVSGQPSDGQYVIESVLISKKVLEVEGEKQMTGRGLTCGRTIASRISAGS